jgi:hypothetical protein
MATIVAAQLGFPRWSAIWNHLDLPAPALEEPARRGASRSCDDESTRLLGLIARSPRGQAAAEIAFRVLEARPTPIPLCAHRVSRLAASRDRSPQIEFDDRGLPLPGIHALGLGQLHVFGQSERRRSLSISLGRFVGAISQWPEVKSILMFGSFASKKSDPGDLDLAIGLDPRLSKPMRTSLRNLLKAFATATQDGPPATRFDIVVLDPDGERLKEIQRDTRRNPPQPRGIVELTERARTTKRRALAP